MIREHKKRYRYNKTYNRPFIKFIDLTQYANLRIQQ